MLGQKLKDEGERLHGYYNKKLQSALKAAGEKALQAEAATRESMKIAEVENERKLTECKDRYFYLSCHEFYGFGGRVLQYVVVSNLYSLFCVHEC